MECGICEKEQAQTKIHRMNHQSDSDTAKGVKIVNSYISETLVRETNYRHCRGSEFRLVRCHVAAQLTQSSPLPSDFRLLATNDDDVSSCERCLLMMLLTWME